MREYPSPPRVHGNGFIQVDLDPRRRLHVWDHRLPRQARDSSIHDHAFWFRSTCCMGTLVNVPMSYTARPLDWMTPTHDLYRVVRAPGSEEDSLELLLAGVRLDAGRDVRLVHPGERYEFRAGLFHATLHLGTTVTVMERDPGYRGGGEARVACRIGEEPDNSWVREQPVPGWAWDLIRRHGGAP